ncbi:MAG: hypothetical protein WAW37_20570 [Syntrophobacteraceae bacterium]
MRRLTNVWKLYILYSTVLLVLMALAGFALHGQLKVRLAEDLKEEVLTLARVIGRVIPESADPSVLVPWCKEYRALAGVRVTLIDADGKVLGDSEGESLTGEARLDRPEVGTAFEEGVATAVRFSKTLDVDMFYAALLVKEKNVVIRLAVPMNKVKSIENNVMLYFASALYLAPLLAMAISFGFARQLENAKRGFTA